MASETDQLARDFEKVNILLAQYPQIQVTKSEGDPPATYEVEYQLNGLTRQADGSIVQAERHMVRINLPFGYPHFPPTVKPLTPVFHPEIDPDAVRITSLWRQNPSLAELIIHIGEMICAKKYNLDEPFNREAADWYSDHSSEFPLDEIQQGEADFQVDDLSMEEDNDLGLSLEIDTPEENIDNQLKEIQHHINKNEIVTAGKLLTALSSSSPEAKRLAKIVSSTLAQRDKLFQELEELENEDNFSEAYEIFKKIQAIAIDTPALSDVGQRLQQSQAMLDTFALPNADTPQAGEKSATPGKVKKTAPKERKTGKKLPEKTNESKPSRPPIVLPVKPILLGLAILAIGGGSIHIYSNEAKKVSKAELDWIVIKHQRCTTPEQFQEKGIKAEKLLVTLNGVWVPISHKKKLETEIRDYLNSPDHKKGKSGDKEYEGRNLPPSVIKILLPIDNKITAADNAIQTKEFSNALILYQKALTVAETAQSQAILESHSETIQEELKKRIKRIKDKLSTIESQVTHENKTKKREKAEEEIKNSLNFFEKLKKKGTSSSKTEGEVNTDELWKDCTQRLQRAERLLDEHPEINSQERQKTVRTFLAYSRLYQYLEVARNSYKEQKFNKAVDEYHHALDLLEEERILFGTKYYQESASKIKRTVVILKVSLELGKAVEAENKNNLRGSLNHYKKVLRIIRSSKASKDSNIKKLERYVRTKINEQSLEAAKSSNQEWWKKNYEKIFKKEFPSARTSLLSKPRIHFIKVKNGLLLYIIRCSEKGITLELTYQYDLATGTWSPYRGKL